MIDYAHNTPANCNHGWRMLVPRGEINFNKGIDRNLLTPNDDVNIW